MACPAAPLGCLLEGVSVRWGKRDTHSRQCGDPLWVSRIGLVPKHTRCSALSRQVPRVAWGHQFWLGIRASLCPDVVFPSARGVRP